jgi:hypothetical protein
VMDYGLLMIWDEPMLPPHRWRPKISVNPCNSLPERNLSAFICVNLRFHLTACQLGDCRVTALLAMTSAGGARRQNVKQTQSWPRRARH